jgi:hypothetical protein
MYMAAAGERGRQVQSQNLPTPIHLKKHILKIMKYATLIPTNYLFTFISES